MKILKIILALGVFFSAFAGLSAKDYVVFVHGRSGKHCGTGTKDVGNYWGSAKNISTSKTKYFVGYDGSTDPRSWGLCRAQSNLYSVIGKKCSGSNWCTIICHSAGCYATSYFLDKAGRSYNIRTVVSAGSAEGGSQLADVAFWKKNGMVGALKTSVARGSYNHNDTKGTPFRMLAGFDGSWKTSAILSGEDDGAVNFASACGYNIAGSFNKCGQSRRYSWRYAMSGPSGADYSSSKKAYNETHSQMKGVAKKFYKYCKSKGWGCK
jgi:triacylglycerol esterase/lipase EstA (alpha/beta hydrolase family)